MVTIPYRFLIGKYPVTNWQYSQFMADGGYRRPEFWGEAGWRWREKNGREVPAFWQRSDFANPIFPVVGVAWYEAEAYCRWLGARAGQIGMTVEAGYGVRLPTELEWERAARGTDRREYPWGHESKAAFANTREGASGGTTAVCTYPQGCSASRVWDMAGNAWEWTSSLYSAKDSRPVLRGGSWGHGQDHAPCAFRNRGQSFLFGNRVGFRVVVSPADSDS